MDQVQCIFDGQHALGECPRWHAQENRLYWVNIPAGELHRLDPETRHHEVRVLDQDVACFAFRQSGGFVLGLRHGLGLIDDWEAPLVMLADPEAGKPDNRFNDGRCDARGRFWAGTMNERKSASDGTLYQLDPDGTVQARAGGVYTSNGVAFSPDGTRLYYADTPRHIVYVFDMDPETGTLGNKRVFARFPEGEGRPDGASVDIEGQYWMALYDGGRVVCLSPEGELLREVAIPAHHCTMISFGGTDGRTAFVTTARKNTSADLLARYPQAGGVFSFRVDVPGLPEPYFAG